MKTRLDTLLVNRKMVPSRQTAQRLIRSKLVKVDGSLCLKSSQMVEETSEIVILENDNEGRYVSRGGLKLEAAIKAFALNFLNKHVLDIGASTGGFTDCSLQHGAKQVVALDVGINQLHPNLVKNPNVVSIEQTNFRTYDNPDYYASFDYIVVDVSFISLSLILENASKYLSKSGKIVALIKPQFEAGPSNVGKNGIVSGKERHANILEKVILQLEQQGLFINQLTYSPIRGGNNGNIEFLGLFSKSQIKTFNYSNRIRAVVQEAYGSFREGDTNVKTN